MKSVTVTKPIGKTNASKKSEVTSQEILTLPKPNVGQFIRKGLL
jgi:hypothetical protein